MGRIAWIRRDKETHMLHINLKQVASAVAAFAVLAMVLSSVFADVTSVARAQRGDGHGIMATVSALVR
jgi:hypothetical protein